MKIGSHIVDEGLIFYIDPANRKSYPGTGTNIKNLINFMVLLHFKISMEV